MQTGKISNILENFLLFMWHFRDLNMWILISFDFIHVLSCDLFHLSSVMWPVPFEFLSCDLFHSSFVMWHLSFKFCHVTCSIQVMSCDLFHSVFVMWPVSFKFCHVTYVNNMLRSSSAYNINRWMWYIYHYTSSLSMCQKQMYVNTNM